MGTTDHYGLKRMGPGENFSDEGWKFTDGDRVLMDRLLYLGAEGHRHIGAAADPAEPGTPTLTLAETSGSIPAGTRVYYKYTLVDVEGFESAPSTEVYVDTSSPVVEPAAVALAVSTTGGTLLPGQYYYVLTAYTTVNTNETKALYPAYITVPTGTSTNKITLTLPTLPTGATGFNVYRKGPGEPRYYHLASTTSTTTYVDTGAVEEDCNRTVPVRNTTNGTNNVTVQVPTLAAGYTWKLYRTYVAGFYNSALVHHVVEETTEGSGIITPQYVDMGLATLTGTPPTTAQTVGSPEQIDLSTEVQGVLPMVGVAGYPFVAEFSVDGALTAQTGTHVWVCEFPRVAIQAVRASLGRGYTPASQSVIVDVNVGRGATPWMTSLFFSSADQPRVTVGNQVGTRVTPTARTQLAEGDVLTIDIDQAGGGATPTDRDLTVTVYGWAYGFTSTASDLYTYSYSTFTPLQIPYMVAWYKADAITGLADTAAVTTWADSSDNGRGATQATSGNRPVYRTNILASKPVVRFDGTNDFLRTSTFSLSKPVTVVAVAKSAVTASVNHTYVDGVAGGELQLMKTGTPQYQLSSGGPASTTTVDTAFHILVGIANGDTDSKLWVDGGAPATGTTSLTAMGGITLGAYGTGGTNFLNGDIAEVILYSGELSLADINDLGQHLATKYSLTWTSATE